MQRTECPAARKAWTTGASLMTSGRVPIGIVSIVMFALFFLFLSGQSLTGFMEYNSDQQDHQQPVISFPAYLTTGHFVEAVFENWESEFLQMGAYVRRDRGRIKEDLERVCGAV